MKNEENKNVYRFKGLQVEVMPYFLYEFTIYEKFDNWYSCILQRYYKSNKYYEIPYESMRYKGHIIEREICLIGAPIEFINENNLSIYELKKRKKK